MSDNIKMEVAVLKELDWLLRTASKRKREAVFDQVEGIVRTVVKTKKFRGFTPRELAVIVVNRASITADRLGHDTGAENWL